METPSRPTAGVGVHLPPRDVEVPSSPWRRLLPRLAIPVVAAMGFVLALNHRSSGVIGAVMGLGVTALIWGIEVPWLLRRQRRKQEERLRKLPNGAFYAGLASTRLPDRRARVQGSLRLDAQGVVFTPTRADRSPIVVPWTAVTRLSLRATPGQPMAATLALTCYDRTAPTFVVRHYSDLARILISTRGPYD